MKEFETKIDGNYLSIFLPNTNRHFLQPLGEHCEYSFFLNYNAIFMHDQYYAYLLPNIDANKPNVIDVGAHIGMFSSLAMEYNSHVYAFEPNPINANAIRMKKHIVRGNIFISDWAISNVYGEHKFYAPHDGESTGMGCIVDDDNKDSKLIINTKVCTLDGIFYNSPIQLEHIDFIKIDTEGNEKNVLNGAMNIIARYKPIIAMSAYHRTEDKEELPETLLSIYDKYDIHLVERDFCEPVFICIPPDKIIGGYPF